MMRTTKNKLFTCRSRARAVYLPTCVGMLLAFRESLQHWASILDSPCHQHNVLTALNCRNRDLSTTIITNRFPSSLAAAAALPKCSAVSLGRFHRIVGGQDRCKQLGPAHACRSESRERRFSSRRAKEPQSRSAHRGGLQELFRLRRSMVPSQVGLRSEPSSESAYFFGFHQRLSRTLVPHFLWSG
jgi:hypothetical protein